MPQGMFPTIVYRQMISLIMNCITVPVWEIPEKDVMALEASDRLIDIV